MSFHNDVLPRKGHTEGGGFLRVQLGVVDPIGVAELVPLLCYGRAASNHFRCMYKVRDVWEKCGVARRIVRKCE